MTRTFTTRSGANSNRFCERLVHIRTFSAKFSRARLGMLQVDYANTLKIRLKSGAKVTEDRIPIERELRRLAQCSRDGYTADWKHGNCSRDDCRDHAHRKCLKHNGRYLANTGDIAEVRIRRRRHGDADRRNHCGEYSPDQDAKRATDDAKQRRFGYYQNENRSRMVS